MYDIGTILKIRLDSYTAPSGIVTGLVVGYNYRDMEPKNVVLWYKENDIEGGIFGVMSYTAHELATRSEVRGKCDISAFLDESNHLKNTMTALEKRMAHIEEELDSILYSKREIEVQLTQLKKEV